MIIHYKSKKLQDPSKFFHSHASGNDKNNIIITSGMVSRKNELTGLNIKKNKSKNDLYEHQIELQFKDIIFQLEEICEEIKINKSDIKDSIIETKVYIVNVKKYFSKFNDCYGMWMGERNNYPARTTIGVADLPSNVVLEMSFILGK